MTKGEEGQGKAGIFVPSGRAALPELRDQANLCLDDPLIHAMLEAVDSYAVVLNAQRQILAANPLLLEGIAKENPGDFLGLRVGEAFHCVHRAEGSDGCGSSRACQGCGALLAVLAAQDSQQPSSGECLLSLQREGRWEAREFSVRARPLVVAGHRLVLLTLKDISAQKRRESLEHIFIHDLVNSLHGLQGWTEMLQGGGSDATVIAARILEMTDYLTEEVESQRRLLLAERNELVPDLRETTPGKLIEDLAGSLDAESLARLISLTPAPDAPALRTDPALLNRILTNMVRNALEAMPAGGQARLWFELRAGQPTFVVQNPGYMPPEVADRVFQRSFSTKAARGRGLGTYGMKVLGETVLGGKVGFTTGWEEGTRFFITLPLGG